VEAGVRFRHDQPGRWDTPARTSEALSKTLLPGWMRRVSALIDDLSERGMLDRTMVYCAGEFGRTPKINPNAGRDHLGATMAVVLAGGGLSAVTSTASTDAQGHEPGSDRCTAG